VRPHQPAFRRLRFAILTICNLQIAVYQYIPPPAFIAALAAAAAAGSSFWLATTDSVVRMVAAIEAAF
jgi:hypothetical protein